MEFSSSTTLKKVTINSERYIGQLMRLKNEIGEKQLQIFISIFAELLEW